jgi:crotonobetainyl-CoA:carnitine CoA-transferase CaiB-like acyl-CoA transferase
MAAPVDGASAPLSLVAQPVVLSRTPSRLASPPPARGQHSDEILAELGLSREEIARLRADNTI